MGRNETAAFRGGSRSLTGFSRVVHPRQKNTEMKVDTQGTRATEHLLFPARGAPFPLPLVRASCPGAPPPTVVPEEHSSGRSFRDKRVRVGWWVGVDAAKRGEWWERAVWKYDANRKSRSRGETCFRVVWRERNHKACESAVQTQIPCVGPRFFRLCS